MDLQHSISFQLEIAPLVPKKPAGISATEVPIDLGAGFSGASEQKYIPLGLRWRLKPELGLPRKPFYVWRRKRTADDPFNFRYGPPEAASFNLGNGHFIVAGAPFYILEIIISNDHPSVALKVEAVDMTGAPILAHFVQLPANRSATIRFQHPFIGGFSAKGNFTIKSINGVSMKHFVERRDEWELIQIVGLPAKENEVKGYSDEKQGYANDLGHPVDNALKRIKIAQQFYVQLASAMPSGMQVPLWEIPEPAEAVDEIREGTPSLIKRINNMFLDVDNGNVHAQSAFRVKEVVQGIHQPEFPGKKTEDATIDMPLLATFLINAISDSWFALASGFGTTDFPLLAVKSQRILEPASYFFVSHDYMVTSTFRFRYPGEVFTDPFYNEDFFALSQKSILPTLPVSGLAASVYSLNRPAERDENWSAEVAVTWTKFNHIQIQGNAVAVAESGLNGNYLNTLRPAVSPDKPALFVPMKPGSTGDPLLNLKNRFIDAQTMIPFTGNRFNRYALASMDPFGRWSDWRETQLQLDARPPESPRLIALSISPDRSGIAGSTCPHNFNIEVLWDWQDRSPKQFQLAGVFHRRRYLPDGTKDNGHIPPADYPAAFQLNNTSPAGALLNFTFLSDSPPGTSPLYDSVPLASDPRCTIELLPQATNQLGHNVDGEMRRYRIGINSISLSFQPDEEWYFTVFLKAAEWRNPTLFSDSVMPLLPGRPPRLTAYVANPIPAPPPVFVPPDIIWSSLPDAKGISRFKLSFDSIPNSTGGYAVYRAFEAKLREKAGLPITESTDLIIRATDLRDVVMPLEKCLDAFTRINTKLIPPPASGNKVEYEVEIPGTVDGLLSFAVASVTREQETSAMSKPWLFVAVPRRSVPGLPLLTLLQNNGSAILVCDFPKAPKPSVVEIFRSRKAIMAEEVDWMGAALHEVNEPLWQSLDEQNKPVSSAANLHHFRCEINEPITPSWFPYFYRAVALGQTDPVNGLIAGRSPQSNLIKIEKLPGTLPDITTATTLQQDSSTILISFFSDIPIETTPHGNFILAIIPFDFGNNSFAIQPVLMTSVNKALPLIATPLKGQLYFGDPDVNNRRKFQVMLDIAGEKYLFRIRLTDPLERSAERMVSGEITATFNPNLSNASVRRNDRDLLVYFESTSPIAPPLFGNFTLDITHSAARIGAGRLLLRTALSSIVAGPLAKLPQATATTIMRDASDRPLQPISYGAIIKKFFQAGFLGFRQGSIRIRLTAPDNSTTVVSVNL